MNKTDMETRKFSTRNMIMTEFVLHVFISTIITKFKVDLVDGKLVIH